MVAAFPVTDGIRHWKHPDPGEGEEKGTGEPGVRDTQTVPRAPGTAAGPPPARQAAPGRAACVPESLRGSASVLYLALLEVKYYSFLFIQWRLKKLKSIGFNIKFQKQKGAYFISNILILQTPHDALFLRITKICEYI